MKQIITFFTFCLIFGFVNAQYYSMPDWTEDLPYSANENDIFAIGISDPRMTDTILAEAVAIHRAISMAVLLNESQVYYASDYFEVKSEEYRWFVMKEDIEELGKFEAKCYVDKSNYEIINKQINKNGETLVLIKFSPNDDNSPNFYISGEYYRQDFEVSNTRSHESIRSLHLNTKWIKTDNNKDTLSSSFKMTNYNGSISSEIYFDEEKITPPGYYYHYKTNLEENFNLADYNTSVKLLKGLWIAYFDSYVQSILSISKNYSSKMETVYDDYKVNRKDGINETAQESLARSVCKNTLSFDYGGIGISNNSLFPRIYISGERKQVRSNRKINKEINSSIKNTKNESKKTRFNKLFSN